MQLFSEVLMYLSLCGLVVLGVLLFAVKVVAPVWSKLRSFLSLPRIQQGVVAIFAVGLIQYAATKGTGYRISFDGGINDNTQNPSYVTNSTVSIRWVRDVSRGVYAPDSATVYIDCREIANTNGEWTALGETTVGAWSWSGTLANATNYNYNVFAYYIPPDPVHTNGMWLYKTVRDMNELYPLPLRARIEINGKAIATPSEKRKDEQ